MPQSPKFKVGDRVRINNKAPAYIIGGLSRRMTRTITSTWYSQTEQHILYQLGSRDHHGFPHLFRASMLTRVDRKQAHKIGRPRQKRQYKAPTKVISDAPSQNLGALSPKQVVGYPKPPDFDLVKGADTK